MSQTAHKFDPTILREYDIRGIVGKHAACRRRARHRPQPSARMVRRKGGKRVALGYDGRLSSPELAAACIEGLTAAGLDVHRASAWRRRRCSISPSITSTPTAASDHRLAQSARLQRLQDDDGQEVVLRRRDPEARRDRRQGRLGERAGQGREEGRPRRLCRAAAAGREARHASSRSPGTPATARSACRSAPSSTSCRASISC